MLKAKEQEIWNKVAKIGHYDIEALAFLRNKTANITIEIGCGSGAWTSQITKQSKTVIGIDFSKLILIKTMYSNLKTKNCMAIVADAENLPIKKNSIDQCIFTFSFRSHSKYFAMP